MKTGRAALPLFRVILQNKWPVKISHTHSRWVALAGTSMRFTRYIAEDFTSRWLNCDNGASNKRSPRLSSNGWRLLKYVKLSFSNRSANVNYDTAGPGLEQTIEVFALVSMCLAKKEPEDPRSIKVSFQRTLDAPLGRFRMYRDAAFYTVLTFRWNVGASWKFMPRVFWL